jgi:hypothetical protein
MTPIMSAEVRQRVPKTSGTGGDAAEGSSPIPKVKSSGSALPISLLDILRVITLLLCASAAASWFITKNDIWWGYGRPPFTTVGYWQHKWVSLAFPPPSRWPSRGAYRKPQL